MRRLRYIIGALLAVLWMAPLSAQEPTGTIRGRVIDNETQQPLSRVTVAVGSRGALTQSDGRFVITGVPAGIGILRARMLGYAPATRSVTVVGGQTEVVDIALTSQAVQLADIVVTGYGEQRAGDITGAVTQINPEEFNPGRIVSPEQLLQSKVAGVQIVDNNEPGGGMTVRIRGTTSVNASSDPLYVLDGMPVGTGAGGGLSAGRNPLNFLNPNDIESITVLKDASAASIYGANAANGVVLIQTKGRGGRLGQQIEYGSSFSASSVTRLPSMLNAAQFRTAVTQHDTTMLPMLGNRTTDWFGLVDRTGYGQEHNLSLTTASDRLYYRISLGYLNQEGIIRGTNTERLALGLNFQQRLFSDRLDLKVNLKGSRAIDRFTPGGVVSNAAQYGPTQPVYDTASATGYYEWPGNTLASADNPVAILNLATDRGTTWRSVGNMQLSYRMPFLEALKLNVNLGYDVTQTERLSFTPNNLHSQTKTGTPPGSFSRSTPSELNTVLETYLNYTAPVGLLPGNVDVTAGYSYGQSHRNSPWFYENGLSTNLLGENGVPTATSVTNGLYITDSKLISFFGRLNYNINDRYIAGFSLRRDGSSRFGPGNQWGVFPSASVAWRLSQEPFMRGFTMLSDLKLRASWARIGNQAIGDYLQYPTYTYGNSQAQYWMGNGFVTTIRPSAVDQNIKWEALASTNIGLDFGFLNQRFSGSIDWYTKKTTDMIFRVPAAGGTTLSNEVTTNIGSMKNTGLEFSLSAKVIDGRGRDLAWTADFTASTNSNELLNINPNAIGAQQILIGGVSGGVGTYIQVIQPGAPVNSFFVCRQAYGTDGKPLENRYLSLVGDTVLTGCSNSQRRPYHSPMPKWQLGHTSRFTWRSLDLSFTLRAYLGSYVYNNIASNLGTYQELSRAAPYNLHTSVLTTGFMSPQYLSDYYVESASFLRMDNIALGYSFNFRGDPWRAFLTVQNAFTITGYSGVDPTAGLGGIDNNLYPRSRTVTGGMSVRF